MCDYVFVYTQHGVFRYLPQKQPHFNNIEIRNVALLSYYPGYCDSGQ